MLKNEKIIAFIATSNPDGSREFYQNRLGLKFTSEEPFALVFELDHRMLRIFKAKEHVPASHTVLGWNVDNIEATIDELSGNGVVFIKYENMEQDARGIWVSPSGAKVA